MSFNSELKYLTWRPVRTHVQGNILKDATRLVEAKLVSSKWTNQQVYCLNIEIWLFASGALRECHIFNSLGIVFCILDLSEGSTTFKKWLFLSAYIDFRSYKHCKLTISQPVHIYAN